MLQLLRAKDAALILGVAPATLKVYRRRGLVEGDRRWLKENIHYVVRTPTVVRYIKDAIEHWAVNDPETHIKWIKAQADAQTSERSGTGRKAKAVDGSIEGPIS